MSHVKVYRYSKPEAPRPPSADEADPPQDAPKPKRRRKQTKE